MHSLCLCLIIKNTHPNAKTQSFDHFSEYFLYISSIFSRKSTFLLIFSRYAERLHSAFIPLQPNLET